MRRGDSMKTRAGFNEVFVKLRDILRPYAGRMVVVADTKALYYLNTHYIWPKNKKPAFFGAARIGKSYVSFHLMPVYAYPELLRNASPALRKHMQGKSCFNFTTVERALFAELRRLTREGYRRFKSDGFLG
ncbi:MAG: hypothetical protein AB1428_09230 [Bacteroidota bacterium]